MLSQMLMPLMLAWLISWPGWSSDVSQRRIVWPSTPRQSRAGGADAFSGKLCRPDTCSRAGARAIAPEAEAQESVSVITKPGCPHCARAKSLLAEKGIDFEEIVLGRDATLTSLTAISGRTTVPQIFMGGKHIGGADDLESYFA